jgi:hypothetical protein
MRIVFQIAMLITIAALVGCSKSESTMKPSVVVPPPTKDEMKTMKGDTAPGP